MSLRSCLYSGSVMHRRLRPRPHRLRYRVFWMLIDIDEIDTLATKLRLFSRNRFNATSFYDSDYGDGSGRPLRTQVEDHMTKAGLKPDGGDIQLFCMPRIFGYGFNPLSVFFCRRRDGSLAAMMYEVHNTFGERHSYLFRMDDHTGRTVAHSCDKDFYVSPFLDMTMNYSFRVAVPDQTVSVAISGSDPQGPVIVAALSGSRAPLTDWTLIRALAEYPLLTIKVIAAIHWHALRMMLKGYRLRTRPPAPSQPVTVVNSPGSLP